MVSVFLYVPNLIGYARVGLAIAAFYYIGLPARFFALYAASCLLDAVDGHAARLLGQSSKFGAVLDMVTDRSTTSGLMCYLASVYPSFMLAFQCLLGLDLSSHYMHMYASLTAGAASHKAIDGRQNWLLRAYYSYQLVLFLVCAGNELFFLGLYLMKHFPNEPAFLNFGKISLDKYQIMTLLSAPVFGFKQFMNVVQLVGASKRLATGEKKNSK